MNHSFAITAAIEWLLIREIVESHAYEVFYNFSMFEIYFSYKNTLIPKKVHFLHKKTKSFDFRFNTPTPLVIAGQFRHYNFRYKSRHANFRHVTFESINILI